MVREAEKGELISPVHTLIQIHFHTQATTPIHNLLRILWLLRPRIEGFVFMITPVSWLLTV